MTRSDKAKLTGDIAVMAKGRGDGQDFFRLEIAEAGKKPRKEILSVGEYRSNSLVTITALRLPLLSGAAQREFASRLQAAFGMKVTFSVATRSGWHKGSFVYPSGAVIGDQTFEVCLPNDVKRYGGKFCERGTLAGWQKLAALAHGNTRLMMAMALAFVGPLGDLLKAEQVMIQLFGAAGSGKSAIATAAGAMWGCNLDLPLPTFSETWNNTVNKIDLIAVLHHAMFLVLDETKSIDDDEQRRKAFLVIAKALMRLAEGATKGRMTDVAAAATWWMGIFSTSNLSLDEMARRDRCLIDDAHRTRLIDVPLACGARGSGAFEKLHGFTDHAALATELKRIAGKHCGVASTRFVEGLVAWRKRDERGLRDRLSERRDCYRRVVKRRIASGQRDLARLHEKFATIFAAGALAIKFGIVPWSNNELGNALLACEQAHVDLVAGAEPIRQQQQKSDPMELLTAHVRQHRPEFIDLRKGLVERDADHDHGTCVGYVNRAPDGSNEFLFSNDKLREICGSLAALLRLKQDLRSDGMLLEDEHRPSTRRTIWKKGKREQVIAIRERAFSQQGATGRLAPSVGVAQLLQR
jgi:hypothetical protein